MRVPALKSTCAVLLCLAGFAPAAHAQTGATGSTGSTGSTGVSGTTGTTASGGYGPDSPPTPTVDGPTAQIVGGVAYPPAAAPDKVKQLIWAANQIIGTPYVYGGGHTRSFESTGYDCSGTVSYALHGAGLLKAPRDSTGFYSFGKAGAGTWITIFTNAGHAYMTVAGIRLDTSAADDPSGAKGPRWRPLRHSDAGFKVRHPANL